MGFLAVIIAAVVGFVIGAVYYGLLSKPWMEASGVAVGEDGKPLNSSNPMPYVVSFVGMILVAGMMRHTFALSGIDDMGKGLVSGFGIGAFFIAPWIFLNVGYSDRPWKLAMIDAGYAILAATAMGGVLTAFA